MRFLKLFRNKSNTKTHVNISIYGANLLCAIIALAALIVTFVAFVLPFMILTTGAFQSSFFETVLHVKSLPDKIKNEIKNDIDIENMSQNIMDNSKQFREIYKWILGISLFALSTMFFLLLVFWMSNFKYILHFLWGILFIYIFLIISLMFYIMRLLFARGEGSYPALARIQHEIIKQVLADKEMREESQKTEKDVNINLKDINLNINLKTQDDTKKEGG